MGTLRWSSWIGEVLMENKYKIFIKEFTSALFNVDFYAGSSLMAILFRSSVVLVILILIFLQLGGL